MKASYRYIALAVLFSFLANICFAEEKAKEEKDKYADLPKSGSLASSIDGGYGNANVQGPFGDNMITSSSPLGGSVSRVSDREWTLKVFNNSEDSFSADYEVQQLDQNRKKLKSDYASFRLGPGESRQRTIRTRTNTHSCELLLKSWKQLK